MFNIERKKQMRRKSGPNKNEKTANRAMKYVLLGEKNNGRDPVEVTKKRKVGYDIVSGDRKIEVKGTSWLWTKQKSGFHYLSENEKQKSTHVYMVCDVFGNPDLHIFETKKLVLKPEVKYMIRFARCRDSESVETLRKS